MTRDITKELRTEIEKIADRAPLLHPDGPTMVTLSGRHRRRSAGLVLVAAVLVVAVAAGGWALWRAREQSPTRVVFHPPPSATSASSSSELVVAEGQRLLFVDPQTGRILRRVHLSGPALEGGPLTARSNGYVYGTASLGKACQSVAVVKVNIATGRESVVVRHAFNGTISPNGAYLAYNVIRAANSCTNGDTRVEDLATGKTSSWDVSTGGAQNVIDLSWAGDSRRLVITSDGNGLPASLMEVLDIGKPQSSTNPSIVGGNIPYQGPVRLDGQELTAQAIYCRTGCVEISNPERLNTIHSSTGSLISSVKLPSRTSGVLFDPYGNQIEVAISASKGIGGQLGLFANGRTRGTITIPPGRSGLTFEPTFGWVPKQVTAGPATFPPSIYPASTRGTGTKDSCPSASGLESTGTDQAEAAAVRLLNQIDSATNLDAIEQDFDRALWPQARPLLSELHHPAITVKPGQPEVTPLATTDLHFMAGCSATVRDRSWVVLVCAGKSAAACQRTPAQGATWFILDRRGTWLAWSES